MAEDPRLDREVHVLQEALSAHRSMLMGALHSNADLDIDNAFRVHAGISKMLARWDEHSANEQRQIVTTIRYLIDSDDEVNDLTMAGGFVDDLAELHKLQAALGYV
jgi:hypothetical protein